MNEMLVIGVIAISPAYFYLLARIVFREYFARKAEYHRVLFKNMSKGDVNG